MFVVMEVAFDGGCDEVEYVAVLLAAGFDDGQQSFNESAASRALGAEAQLTPDHGVTHGTLSHVVCGLNSHMMTKRPQRIIAAQQFLAGCRSRHMRAAHAVFQRQVHSPVEPVQVSIETHSRQAPIPSAMQVSEEFGSVLQQFRADRLCGPPGIDHRLKVSFQVCPAPLDRFQPKVHFGSIAGHDTAISFREQFFDHFCFAQSANGKHGEVCRRHNPGPGFQPPCFVGDSSALTAVCVGRAATSS